MSDKFECEETLHWHWFHNLRRCWIEILYIEIQSLAAYISGFCDLFRQIISHSFPLLHKFSDLFLEDRWCQPAILELIALRHVNVVLCSSWHVLDGTVVEYKYTIVISSKPSTHQHHNTTPKMERVEIALSKLYAIYKKQLRNLVVRNLLSLSISVICRPSILRYYFTRVAHMWHRESRYKKSRTRNKRPRAQASDNVFLPLIMYVVPKCMRLRLVTPKPDSCRMSSMGRFQMHPHRSACLFALLSKIRFSQS